MITNFKIFSDMIAGEIEVKENSQFNNIQAEKILVHSNVTARLFGTVKDVTIKKDAIVFIHGSILGNVVNEGGKIHLHARDL